MNGIPLRGRPLRFVDDPYEEANSGEEIEDYNEEDSDSENYEEDDY